MARSRNFNQPNSITFARILIAPVVFWLVLSAAPNDVAARFAACALFVVVLASDGVDGAIARKRGLITDLGKLLDPIADKLVTNGTLVCLSVLGELPWWVTGIIVLREVGITLWRLVEARAGKVLPAAGGGKLKTVAQALAISFALAPFPQLLGEWFNWVNTALMAAAFTLTVSSGVSYLAAARAQRSAR